MIHVQLLAKQTDFNADSWLLYMPQCPGREVSWLKASPEFAKVKILQPGDTPVCQW
jgi:hypothetical protein